MPPTGPPRPEYDQKPNQPFGPGFRPAEGPEGPQANVFEIRPVSLLLRGAREGQRSSAYKPLSSPLSQRGGTKFLAPGSTTLWSRFVAPTGTNAHLWSRLVASTGTNATLQSRLVALLARKYFLFKTLIAKRIFFKNFFRNFNSKLK